ncbi:rhomboid family intramembrane serine protease [Euhalothece natronophila Z-M001]|uniref:Rhomboid family intramembrane serine protease n=1 Tax=Euhalothece natronophila Z-M001 TaxID=522448 RepID=A0A5B8NS94_9CHRO|nr:rhomboid family intramembrane serine protease [Euhalothece natronophila]QDZ40910.1 rhomboid family intramembrane serine protease [Euhalothece natronophila Z-M001]
MDINIILLWLVTISCVSLALRVLLSRRNWGWLVTASLILVVMGSVYSIFPSQAGIIGGILWLLFILIPVIGLRQVNHLVYQERFRKARRIATVLSWLHPGDGWWEQPKFLLALELAKKGETDTAKYRLENYFNHSSYNFELTAKAIQFRMEARWEDCLHWLRTEVPDSIIWENSNLVITYLQALGEVGDINGLIWTIKAHQQQLEYLGDSIPINLARLYVFAFSGDVRTVNKLCQTSLNFYPKNRQKFWLATAYLAQGDEEKGRNLLLSISEKDISLENSINQRLNKPIARAIDSLTAESVVLLERIKKNFKQEINYKGAISITPTKAYTTYFIMAINIIIFMVAIPLGGSANVETLYHLGAAVPEEIASGEPWRVFTANFLHFGYTHLVSNLLGLWILGPYVEFYLGWLRYLLIYLLSGVGAISLFALFAIMVGREEDILVGASAAIMGLMGATFIILLRGWIQEKSSIAQERLRLVILIIALQVMFDFTVPNVSFFGHTAGLILGMLLTSLTLLVTKRKSTI